MTTLKTLAAAVSLAVLCAGAAQAQQGLIKINPPANGGPLPGDNAPETKPISAYTLEEIQSGAPFDGHWTAFSGPAAGEGLPADVLPPNQVLRRIDEYLKPEYAKAHQDFDRLEAEGVEQKTVQIVCLPYNMPGERQESRLEQNYMTTPKVWVVTAGGWSPRLIHIGAEHPKDLKPSYLGHSVGHWEGDTLVVDTVGFNDQGMLENGVRHTEQLHVTARYNIITINGRNAIRGIYTYDDPGSMVKPMKFARVLVSVPPGTLMSQENMCNENNRPR
jgi:hypothetical protein